MAEHDRTIRIGTRGSLLAVTQTNLIVAALRAAGAEVEVERVTTRGDCGADDGGLDIPISSLGSDGVFVREIEQALLDGRIDAAVHSLKDLPTAETPGLDLACVPVRAMPFDVLVCRSPATLESLPPGSVVGTSSIRRVMQLRAARPDLLIRPIRGNVDTRLRKLDAGEFDALVLAGAGLQRLGRSDRIAAVLEPPVFWPAVAQGALVVQTRGGDERVQRWLAALDDPPTHAAVWAERAFLATLAGGCLAPIGAWAHTTDQGGLVLGGCVLEESAGSVRRVVAEDSAAAPRATGGGGEAPIREWASALGRRVAGTLLAHGAAAMLDRMRQAGPGTPIH